MAHPDHTVSERNTTTTTTTSGGSGMGFIVGALVVIVGILAYVVFGDGFGGASGANDVNITVEGAGDAAQGAAEAVDEAVSGGAAASE
ncbi:hypothetical protein Z946_2998 [Sulfitobacter noctilucicola]|uniref:Uncharacterized protein n=1 Tax=Sulfitobacter noctilucicola TaxID=1342301 RepID=A0A7W6Q739_9RHOB|nr:hypothetical protein [Sulfitobacter noctilucicola]KIN64111.1 hypothetical protein Z946_2998 [Sulfitobacter noctilucicola]MBB4175465.1 hypothetical protein [Sulfitobacter noctilucicola]